MQVKKIGVSKWTLPLCDNYPTVTFDYDDWKAGQLKKSVAMTDYEITGEDGQKVVLPFFDDLKYPYVAALELDENPMISLRGYLNTLGMDMDSMTQNEIKEELLKFLVPRHMETSYILFYRTPEDYEGIIKPEPFMSNVVLNYPEMIEYSDMNNPITALVTMNTGLDGVSLYSIIPEKFMSSKAHGIAHASHINILDEDDMDVDVDFSGIKYLVFLTKEELKDFDDQCNLYDKEHEA